MSRWARSPVITICGRCAGHISVGDPVLVLELPGIKRARVRCAKCDGPAPPDLPPHVIERAPTPLVMARFAADMLPLNFKQSREPGEDDE